MLNLITDIFKPNERIDPLLGVMKFRRTFIIFGEGFWRGEINFTPVGKKIIISISAGKSGVSEAQRDFYRQVEQKYPEIIDRTRKILYETLLNYGINYSGDDTRDELLEDCVLDSLYIPSFREENSEWQLSFFVSSA